MRRSTRIGVDVGGTFTDLVLHDPARGLTRTGKLPTTPDAPSRAIVAGIERLLRETGTAASQVSGIVHGTTLITNTLLERTGAKVGLITTEGFRDILEMGREIRYDVTDLHARPAPVLVPRHRRVGVPGRVTADGAERSPLDETAVCRAACGLVESGIDSLAIAFLHSYANPAHERRARDLVHDLYPDLLITLSSEVAPEIREYERTSTACVNAYVQPAVHRYLSTLETDLRAAGLTAELSVMLSSGGLTTAEQARAVPVRLLESGPAAGVIAAGYLAARAREPRVVSFDMGGTTAKMCLIEDGRAQVRHEFEAARLDKFKPGSGLPVKLAVIDMIEIGAGGGSIAHVDELGLMKVGPRSAGAVPGPVAYGRGGADPTVTDADLLAGYLDPADFLGGEMDLDRPGVMRAVAGLAAGLGLDVAGAGVGIENIVTENMAAATRMHLAEKGRDPRDCTLIAFGGAGPVHAYTLAKALKMPRVIVPAGAGVMSAFGFLVAEPSVAEVRGYPAALGTVDWDRVAALYAEMEARARELLRRAGAAAEHVVVLRLADMRYLGQGYEITVPLPDAKLSAAGAPAISEAFARTYKAAFGRVISDGTPELINWRLSATCPATPFNLPEHAPAAASPATRPARRGHRTVRFAGTGRSHRADVYDRCTLPPGSVVRGPAVFAERETSCVIGPDCTVTVDADRNLIIDIDQEGTR